MNQESMYKLQEMCCKEIDKIVQRGDLTASTLEQAAMLVDTIKDTLTIEAMEEDGGEYSQTGRSYDGGGSYANRGQHYVRGHYSRDSGGGGYSGERTYSRGHYSRDAEKDDMMKRLERMMEQSNDSGEAEAYRRAMEQLRNA